MTLRRPVTLALVAVLALAPVLVVAGSAAAAYPAPFVGASYKSIAYVDGDLAGMTVGVPYSDSITRAAGYDEWEPVGDLPAGLVATASGDDYLITGTPTTPGEFSFRIDSRADGDDWDAITFAVTVVDSPTADLHGVVSPDITDAMAPGEDTGVWFEYVNDSEDTAAVQPTIVITFPAGITNLGGGQQGDWICTGLQIVTCTSPSSIDPGTSGVAYTAGVQISSDYAKSFYSFSELVSAKNSPASTYNYTMRVSLPLTVVEVPQYAPYSNVTLIAYAPEGRRGGYMQFKLSAASGTVQYFDYLSVDYDTGAATYSGAIDPAFGGETVEVTATLFDGDGVQEPSETVTFTVYNQLNVGGSFYLNGQPYTDSVGLYIYADGDYPGLFYKRDISGGSYAITPGGGVPYGYYMWAELTDLGAAMSFYNTAGDYVSDYAGHTMVGPNNFTDSMNFYWEIAPTFTHATMAVPRQNVTFSEFFVATSNVSIAYSIGNGDLPTGLHLNPVSGEVYGTPSVLGEEYSFTITADNGYGTTTSDPVTGTVRAEHIVPSWTDETLVPFRFDQAVTDGVAAEGDPTISYSVFTGELPTGVTITPNTGALVGTPSELGEDYEFELRAHSEWGDVYASFDGTVLDTLAAPVWADNSLGEIRVGEALTDGVSASGEPAPTYTVTGLPSWAALNATTGAFTASPIAEVPYDFTITAHNSEGDSAPKRFTGTALPAWVAPFWVDDTVPQLQAGVALDDQVVAAGDGTIVYSVPIFGTMPSWLTLNGSNGLLSGTPPLSSLGDGYSFTLIATSEHGSVPLTISGVVAAAPAVAIDLDFAVGDLAAGAGFDFSVAGAGDDVPYSVTANSTPVIVASGTTSGLGAASGTAALPTLAAGAHSLVLLTFASDGTPRTITVWFTVLANGTIGAISRSGPLVAPLTAAALAATGSDAAVPIGVALLLLLGGVVAVRQRRLVG